MTHIAILSFFGLALLTGLYCFWVSLRVESARVPRLLQMHSSSTYPAISSSASSTIRPPASSRRS